jgi:hypothetical protein
MNRYCFDMAESKAESIGWRAIVNAESKGDAVKILKSRMKRTSHYLVVHLGALTVDDAQMENE